MRELFGRLKRRTPNQPTSDTTFRDWTTAMTPRDWADLPTHHPRRETDAL